MTPVCDKCGEPMEIITVKKDGFLAPGEVAMCKKCRRLQPIIL